MANAGLVLAGVVSFVLMGAAQSLYGPALPGFARDFGITAGQAGLLVSAHWVGSVLAVAALYLRADCLTPRRALLAMASGAALVAWGPGLWATLAGAAVLGLGYGASTVIYNRRMLGLFGARGPSMLALLNAIFGIGAIGAPLAFVAIGSDATLAFLAVAGLSLAALALAGPPGAPAEAAATAKGTRSRFAPRPGILTLGALAIGIEASLIGLGPTALIAQGQSEPRAAELLSLFFLAFLAMRLVLVGFANRLHPLVLFILALAAAALCAMGAALTAHPGWFVALGGCAGLFFPGYFVAGTRLMGEDARVAPTLIAMGMAGGIALPVGLAMAMGQAGDAALFAMLAGLAAVAAVAALLLRTRFAAAAA